MSYGLPIICSPTVASKFKNNVLNYKNEGELIQKILTLKSNRNLSNKMSKKSINFIKKYDWKNK